MSAGRSSRDKADDGRSAAPIWNRDGLPFRTAVVPSGSCHALLENAQLLELRSLLCSADWLSLAGNRCFRPGLLRAVSAGAGPVRGLLEGLARFEQEHVERLVSLQRYY